MPISIAATGFLFALVALQLIPTTEKRQGPLDQDQTNVNAPVKHSRTGGSPSSTGRSSTKTIDDIPAREMNNSSPRIDQNRFTEAFASKFAEEAARRQQEYSGTLPSS